FMLFWFLIPMRFFSKIFHYRALKHIDGIIPLENQTRKDTWQVVSPIAYRYIQKTGSRYSLRFVRQDYEKTHRIYTQGAREIRKALNELSNMKPDQAVYDGLSAPIRDFGTQPEPLDADSPHNQQYRKNPVAEKK
ncbi:MAG: hypothetical protein ACOCR8_03395, partial [Desulfosalsimonas sp.]